MTEKEVKNGSKFSDFFSGPKKGYTISPIKISLFFEIFKNIGKVCKWLLGTPPRLRFFAFLKSSVLIGDFVVLFTDVFDRGFRVTGILNEI